MATVAVSGSSGFVGTALCRRLRELGHHVRPLTRAGIGPVSPLSIAYEPGTPLEPSALEDCDAVVHLAGENIAKGRWTKVRRQALRDSRVRTTASLAAAIAEFGSAGPRWVSASAVGYYGDSGDRTVDERTAAGKGFLAELCADWEAATSPAASAGALIANARLGLVLGAEGGTLAALRPIFRWGLGGRIGSGAQWMSWICLQDTVEALIWLATDRSLQGPVNLTAPMPVTNRDFTRALAEAFGRPAVLPLPGAVARAALGQFADEALLAGQRVLPTRLTQAGFAFRHPELGTCLAEHI